MGFHLLIFEDVEINVQCNLISHYLYCDTNLTSIECCKYNHSFTCAVLVMNSWRIFSVVLRWHDWNYATKGTTCPVTKYDWNPTEISNNIWFCECVNKNSQIGGRPVRNRDQSTFYCKTRNWGLVWEWSSKVPMAFRGGLYFDNLLGVSDSWKNIAEERANFMFTLITFIICQGLWLLTVMEGSWTTLLYQLISDF